VLLMELWPEVRFGEANRLRREHGARGSRRA
jgi:hypothetical protein